MKLKLDFYSSQSRSKLNKVVETGVDCKHGGIIVYVPEMLLGEAAISRKTENDATSNQTENWSQSLEDIIETA